MSAPQPEHVDVPRSPGGVGVWKVVTSGRFELDGGSWAVDNNVWVVGTDDECVVIDPAHDADAVLAAVGDRTVLAVLCTHAHNDHVGAVPGVVAATGAPVRLHPEDHVLWDQTHDHRPDAPLADGDTVTVGDVDLRVLHTPGHSPGACCLHAPRLGVVFSGDTLFHGGPGATGRSYSDHDVIVASIRDRLLTLPPDTVVLTGHGESTRIGDEAAHSGEWGGR